MSAPAPAGAFAFPRFIDYRAEDQLRQVLIGPHEAPLPWRKAHGTDWSAVSYWVPAAPRPRTRLPIPSEMLSYSEGE
jgi:hypothetical protein